MNVYVSLTSIRSNVHVLVESLKSIKNQSVQPDKCYVFLSDEPYLFDQGFKDKNIDDVDLQKILSDDIFVVRWVDNTGPYRKLLPILKEKTNEDCVIITIDDDTVYHPDIIKNYLYAYDEQQCVIAARSHTLKFDKIEHVDYETREKINHKLSLYNFHTGKGGVLYHPKFFQKSIQHIFDSDIYNRCCPYGDDIWFNFHRIANNVKCFIPDCTTFTKDLTTTTGLFNNINRKNNNNTKQMIATIQELKNRGYSI